MIKKIIYKFSIHIIVPIYSIFILRHKKLIEKSSIKLISEEEKIKINNDKYFIHGKINLSFLKINSYILKKKYLCMLDTGWGLSSSNYPVFFNKSFRLLEDSINYRLSNLYYGGFYLKIIKRILFKSDNKNISNVISFAGIMADNKFHWLIEYLPRLKYVIDNNLQNKFYFIIPESNNKFNEFHLKMFGINNIIKWNNEDLKIKNLYILPSYFEDIKKNSHTIYSKNSILWLNNFIINKYRYGVSNKKNYFILRKKKFRSFSNEDDLVKLLTKFNFHKIYLEDFEEIEIIKIFQSANIILASHGAAISNMIYSNNLKIIELFPRNSIEEDLFCFYQLSQILNFEHHLVICDKMNKNGSYKANLLILADLLKELT